ncbi:MAG: glycosyltransferase family 4 protein, partial [Coriobacteriia bacterium]|nr:glycosyltransferase family 4 protein [Coriobacteriia bacterium]
IRRFSPDIVHAHNWIGRSYLPISRTSGARYVVTLHDCSRACAQGRMMYRGESYCHPTDALRCLDCCTYQYGAIKGFVTLLGNRVVRRSEMRAVDLYLPVSKAVAEANQLADGRARYEIVPNFVDDAPVEHGELPREIELLPTEPFILQVGDVVDDKGVRVLLEAYTGLESPPPLVLIGRIAPEMRAELPPGVVATGPLPHALVAEAWRRSFFGTMPSLCLDACPTVTLEAMAASKPVVASARGGLTDQVVGGQTGFLVPPGDALALRDAMARLIADSALRRRMGDAARKRFEGEFRADVIIDRIQRLYCEVAEG